MLANTDRSKTVVKGITLALALGTIVLAFLNIESVLNIANFTSVMLTGAGVASGTLMLLTFLMGMVTLAFIIVTFEYHLKHAGTRRSTRLLRISLATHGALFLVGYVGLGLMA